MGYFKDLLIRCEDGDVEAMKRVAEFAERRGNYKEALKWYSKSGQDKKANEMLTMMNQSDVDKEILSSTCSEEITDEELNQLNAPSSEIEYE